MLHDDFGMYTEFYSLQNNYPPGLRVNFNYMWARENKDKINLKYVSTR
jgi:hypothetical protein